MDCLKGTKQKKKLRHFVGSPPKRTTPRSWSRHTFFAELLAASMALAQGPSEGTAWVSTPSEGSNGECGAHKKAVSADVHRFLLEICSSGDAIVSVHTKY